MATKKVNKKNNLFSVALFTEKPYQFNNILANSGKSVTILAYNLSNFDFPDFDFCESHITDIS